MLSDTLRKYIEYYAPDWQQRLNSLKKMTRKWAQDLKNAVLSLTALLLTVTVIYAALLFLMHLLWQTFQETHVGQTFRAHAASDFVREGVFILSGPIPALALTLCTHVALTCAGIGLLAQLLCIRRYFFEARTLINHLGWYAAAAAVTALKIHPFPLAFSFPMGMFLSFFPSCCLLKATFSLTRLLVPECSIIFALKEIRKIRQTATIRNESDPPA